MNSVIPENFVCFELVVDSQQPTGSPLWHLIDPVNDQPASLEFGVEMSSCTVPWFA